MGEAFAGGIEGPLYLNLGLWIRDQGSFLRQIFLALERDSASLKLEVKHLGQHITCSRGN